DTDLGGRFQHHQRNSVTVAKVMMIRNNHPVTQSALTKSCLQIWQSLVTVLWIVFAGTHRRSLFPTARLILTHSQVGDLRLAIHHRRHAPLSGIVSEFNPFGHEVRFTTESEKRS